MENHNVRISTMWVIVTNQYDVFLDTKNLQTNEGLRRGELCPCNNKSFIQKRFIEQNFNSFQNVYNRYKDNPLWVQ